MTKHVILTAVLLALATALPANAQRTSDWRMVREYEGITVSVMDAGRALPHFRAAGEVQGTALHILAVVLDGARAHEWSDDADENAVLHVEDARTQVVYTRSHQPWPVRDRDLVMRRRVEILLPNQVFRVQLSCVPGEKPAVRGVIRIQHCETEFRIRALDRSTTWVEYRVSVDPGGSSPDWLVRAASENGPLHTLLGLREQVARTRGQYSDVIRAWTNAK